MLFSWSTPKEDRIHVLREILWWPAPPGLARRLRGSGSALTRPSLSAGSPPASRLVPEPSSPTPRDTTFRAASFPSGTLRRGPGEDAPSRPAGRLARAAPGAAYGLSKGAKEGGLHPRACQNTQDQGKISMAPESFRSPRPGKRDAEAPFESSSEGLLECGERGAVSEEVDREQEPDLETEQELEPERVAATLPASALKLAFRATGVHSRTALPGKSSSTRLKSGPGADVGSRARRGQGHPGPNRGGTTEPTRRLFLSDLPL